MGRDSMDYEELYEGERDEDIIERLEGTISEGDCAYSGCNGRMRYDKPCFICDVCKRSTHESLYYLWYEGRIPDLDYDED